MLKQHEAYAPANITPFEFDNQAQSERVISEAVQQRVGETTEGQHFSGIHITPTVQSNADVTVVRLNSLFGDSATVDQQYIAAQYAAAFPEWNYLAVDLPGHGVSDGLTKPQYKAAKEGDLSKVSTAQFEAAIDMAGDTAEMIVTGEAVGQLMAVSFALEAIKQGIKVRNIFGFDPTGMERRFPAAIATSYMRDAQKHRSKRDSGKNLHDMSRLEAAYEDFDAYVTTEYGPTKHATRPGHAKKFAKERAVGTFMLRHSPFTHDTGMQLTRDVLEQQPDTRISYVFGGKSVVGRLTGPVQSQLDQLHQENAGKLEYTVWPQDNQSIGTASHQPRLIQYVADNITPLK